MYELTLDPGLALPSRMTNYIMPKKLFIISGPSGAGEDSVIEGLKKKFDIEKIITTTTRPIRPTEKNGREYYFIDKEEFKKKIANQEFFEWAKEDNGQLYGGTLAEVERVKNSDKIGIWKIEYQGAITAKTIEPTAISIFIYIPIELIEKRLKNRGNVSEECIRQRLQYAQGWFDNRDKFDYEVEKKKLILSKNI